MIVLNRYTNVSLNRKPRGHVHGLY